MEAIFYQLYEAESSTYTYLVGDPDSKDAILIDPVRETMERDLKLLGELGLNLKYVLDTHVHADHVTAAGELRKRTGAKTALGAGAGVDCADIMLKDGEVLCFGSLSAKAIFTPGHTSSCVSYLVGDAVFTGDALLIRGTGRTDFQGGSAPTLYRSITQKLFSLPDDTWVYPAHDYRGQTHSTIGLEKRFNPRVCLTMKEVDFIEMMQNLKLADPKKMHEAVPANLACGQAKA